MKIILLAVGRLRSAPLREICADYLTRLKRYGPSEIAEVKAADSGEAARRIAQESARLLEQLAPGDHILVLDERGKQMTSVELSQTIKTFEMRAKWFASGI